MSALDAAAAHVNADGGYPTPEAALRGREDIVAEVVAEDAEHIADMRAFTARVADVTVEAIDADEKTVYEPYYDLAEASETHTHHRVLAVNRGEKEGKLRVRVRVDADEAIDRLGRRVVRRQGPFADALDAAIADSYSASSPPRLCELRSDLTERAQADAIRMFARTRRLCCSSVPCATRA